MHGVQLNDMGVDGGFGRGGDEEVLEFTMHDEFASGVVVAVAIMFMAVWYKAEGAGGAWQYGGQVVEVTMVVQIGGAYGGGREW